MPDQSASGATRGDREEGSDEHVLLEMVGLLGRSDTSATSLELLSRKARAHVERCAYCSLGITLLSDVALPGSHVEPHPAPMEHAGPSLEDQARYASIASVEGTPIADARMPHVRSHLDRCEACAELMRDLIADDDNDDDEDNENAEVIDGGEHTQPAILERNGPTKPLQQASWWNVWNAQGERERILLAPYVVTTGDLTLDITSALPDPRITIEFASDPHFRAAPPLSARSPEPLERQLDQSVKKEQSFTLDLRDDPQIASWIRVKVHLAATGTGRLICYITAYEASAERVGNPMEGVRWRIDHLTAPGEWVIVANGETNITGAPMASWKQQGEMRLVVQAQGHDWIVPLLIQGS